MRNRRLIIVFCILLFIIIWVTIYDMFIIYQYGKTDEKQKSDVAIILGAETDKNGVSPVYAERINHGIWLYENHYVDYIIVTGGKSKETELSDAYIAKRYAVFKGIPENVIYTEEQSEITQENIEYSKKIMESNNWDTCIIVSDPMHMKRAMLMAKDYKLQALSSPTQTTRYCSWKTKLPFLLREEFFYLGYRICRFLSII